jgi:hypothetical protein
LIIWRQNIHSNIFKEVYLDLKKEPAGSHVNAHIREKLAIDSQEPMPEADQIALPQSLNI